MASPSEVCDGSVFETPDLVRMLCVRVGREGAWFELPAIDTVTPRLFLPWPLIEPLKVVKPRES